MATFSADLGAVLDSLPYAITTVDVEGNVLFVNRAAAANLSCTPEEAVGKHLSVYFADLAVAACARIRQTVRQRTVQTFEALVPLPDGSERVFLSEYCPTFDEAGDVESVQIVARDITSSHAAQTEPVPDKLWGLVSDDLSMSRARLRAILENAPIVVSIYDLDMTTRYMSRLLPDLKLDQVLGRSPLEWLVEASRGAFRRAFAAATEQREVSECEVVGVSGRSWLIRFAPLVHGDRVTQVLACSIDVTDKARLHAQLMRKQKNESLGTMARGIAHDFNNLLTAILGSAELAHRQLGRNTGAARLLEEITVASRRAASLCAQMLTFAGHDPEASGESDLNRVVRDMARLTRAAVDDRIVLTYDLTDPISATQCGCAQLSQVVANLVNNSADAIGDAGGEIHITTRSVVLADPPGDWHPEPPRPGRYVQLIVSDTGKGISSADRQRIFDPFFSTKETGHGLGLSVVLGIVASAQGAIDVSSSSDGTTMTLLFPALDHDVSSSSDTAERQAWPTGHGQVLVADDEDAVRRVVEAVLRSAGYTVITATNGWGAVEAVEKHGGSLRAVVLDVTMPGLDGMNAYAKIRELRKDLPVLLSSGRPFSTPSHDPRVRSLTKPFSANALLEALELTIGA